MRACILKASKQTTLTQENQMKLKTQSVLNDLGQKCWLITRGTDNPVVVLPAPSNKSKYIVNEGDAPKTLKEIKQDVLDGKHDHFADKCTKIVPDSPSEAPSGVWDDCVAPQVLLALVASECSSAAIREEIYRTLDCYGYLVDGEADWRTATLVFEKDRKK